MKLGQPENDGLEGAGRNGEGIRENVGQPFGPGGSDWVMPLAGLGGVRAAGFLWDSMQGHRRPHIRQCLTFAEVQKFRNEERQRTQEVINSIAKHGEVGLSSRCADALRVSLLYLRVSPSRVPLIPVFISSPNRMASSLSQAPYPTSPTASPCGSMGLSS